MFTWSMERRRMPWSNSVRNYDVTAGRQGGREAGRQEGLRTWEVNLAYMEHGEKKNALVKLSEKL